MKNSIESVLAADHESLARLLAELDRELASPNIARAFELLDLFWARLAVHIRAENLHLFPALADAPVALFSGKDGLPTAAETHDALARLRSDHDFFMKELAQLIKIMREIADIHSSPGEEVEAVRQRMVAIKGRLEVHNDLEEQQVYQWPALFLDAPAFTRLCQGLSQELDNLPPRFTAITPPASTHTENV
ncbi:MAG: hemerythrin domain-containing protein [Pyrinomonadaceae bacterium]